MGSADLGVSVLSKPCNNLAPSNDDFNGFSLFAIFFEIKGYFTEKKLHSDFSYILAYLTLRYERNRIFHPCCDMFDFYGQALLRVT